MTDAPINHRFQRALPAEGVEQPGDGFTYIDGVRQPVPVVEESDPAADGVGTLGTTAAPAAESPAPSPPVVADATTDAALTVPESASTAGQSTPDDRAARLAREAEHRRVRGQKQPGKHHRDHSPRTRD